jgi:hypothetical protein
MSNSSIEDTAATKRPFCFMVAVWGQPYCQSLIDFCLPSLLAPDNLPRLDAAAGHRLLIATTRQDWERIEHLPVMERIRRHVTPTLLEIGTPPAPGYEAVLQHQTRCLKQLFDAAYRYRSYGCLLLPDVIFSNHMVLSLQRAVRESTHLLLITALRQVEEDVLAELSDLGLVSKDRPLSISAEPLTIEPRPLVDLAVRHLHPEIAAFAEGQRRQRARPPFRFWRAADGRGLILHTFYALPVLMDFAVVPADHTSCLDYSDFESVYLGYAYRRGQVRVVSDSDECGVLSLTPRAVNHTRKWRIFERGGARIMPQLALLADLRNSMAAYVRKTRDVVRRDTFRQSVNWHTTDIDESWLSEETRINRLIDRAAGDYYTDPSHFPASFGRDQRYWLFDLVGALQQLLRYVYSLQFIFAALTGHPEKRAIVRRKLTALAAWIGVAKP